MPSRDEQVQHERYTMLHKAYCNAVECGMWDWCPIANADNDPKKEYIKDPHKQSCYTPVTYRPNGGIED